MEHLTAHGQLLGVTDTADNRHALISSQAGEQTAPMSDGHIRSAARRHQAG